tara:strand:+ start:1090 stop:1806 length:717 start_codon:yes stop_codon:yes gene_type:complete
MEDFFTMIGSIASLVSIPLAIYLSLKSKEAKFDKLKKDIVRTLSYQIGDERLLSTFEIKTVISSKLRENRIKTDSITVSEIIEDLVSETISSPLIGKDKKTEILLNLKKIYHKGEIFDEIESIEDSEIVSWEKAEPRIKSILENKIRLDKSLDEYEEKNDRYKQRMSTVFAITAFLVTTITLIISIIGKEEFHILNNKLNEPFKEYEFIITVIMGAVTSIFAGLTTFLIRKRKNRKSI